MKSWYKIIIPFFYLLPAVVLAYLLWQNLRPDFLAEYDLVGKNPAVSEIVPLSRTGGRGYDVLGAYMPVIAEPVYLDVKIPRRFDGMEVAIEYSDLQNEIFEVGISRDEARKNFEFVTLENKIFDGLGWHKIEEDGLVLYQRHNFFGSIEDFLKNPGSFYETIISRAELEPKISGQWASGETKIDFPILGSAKLMVYHKGGDLNLSVETKDEYTVNIYDDQGAPIEAPVSAGIYKIEIVGNKGAIFDKIKINSSYVAILDGLRMGDLIKPASLYLAGSRFLAKIDKSSATQDILAGGELISVQKPFWQYEKVFGNRQMKKITIPKGGIEIGGTMFFLNPTRAFYPRYENFYNGIDLEGVNFILAKYSSSNKLDIIKKASASFNISGTPTPGGKLRFLLSFPGAGEGEIVKIRSAKFRFSGERFNLSDLFNKLMKLTKLKN